MPVPSTSSGCPQQKPTFRPNPATPSTIPNTKSFLPAIPNLPVSETYHSISIYYSDRKYLALI